MSSVTSPLAFTQASAILLPLGEYFQVQDDYLDCYGEAEAIGKIGTDILDNKCSWLINTALGLVNVEQRKVLDVSSSSPFFFSLSFLFIPFF
jgi:farnesyl diphosphate synthase